MGYLLNIVLVIICFYAGESNAQNTQLTKTTSTQMSSTLLVRRLGNLWNWIQDQSKAEDTFIGRCFGIGRKLKFVMPLLIFVLGVIVTTLKFLTIFSLKGLGIGLLLLMLNVGGLFAKLGAAFKSHSSPPPYHQPQNVHFHVHNKDDGHYSVDHSSTGYGWSDRISEGLSKTNSLAEKLELLNLYKRLGFHVNGNLALNNYR